MSFRWLSRTVSGGRSFGGRRRAAPEARRDLADEIDAHAAPLLRIWRRDLVLEPGEHAEPTRIVVAWIETDGRPEVAAWLGGDGLPLDVRTDWLFFPAGPEAVLLVVVGEETPGLEAFRVNVRIAADPYRKHLERLAKVGRLGLTAEPIAVGPARELLSPCVFAPVQTEPLRRFLREIPPPPVV